MQAQDGWVEVGGVPGWEAHGDDVRRDVGHVQVHAGHLVALAVARDHLLEAVLRGAYRAAHLARDGTDHGRLGAQWRRSITRTRT